MINLLRDTIQNIPNSISYNLNYYGVGIKKGDYIPVYTLKKVYEVVAIGEKEGIVYILPSFPESPRVQKKNYNFFYGYNECKMFNNELFFNHHSSIILTEGMIACIFMIKKEHLTLEKTSMLKNIELWIDSEVLFNPQYSSFKKAFYENERTWFKDMEIKIKINILKTLFPFSIKGELNFASLEEAEKKKKELKELFKKKEFYEYIS